MINQISHAKGGVIHSYHNTSASGFNSGGQRGINNSSFKSQQPTESSKAKQVTLPNRKLKEASYSLALHPANSEPVQQAS